MRTLQPPPGGWPARPSWSPARSVCAARQLAAPRGQEELSCSALTAQCAVGSGARQYGRCQGAPPAAAPALAPATPATHYLPPRRVRTQKTETCGKLCCERLAIHKSSLLNGGRGQRRGGAGTGASDAAVLGFLGWLLRSRGFIFHGAPTTKPSHAIPRACAMQSLRSLWRCGGGAAGRNDPYSMRVL